MPKSMRSVSLTRYVFFCDVSIQEHMVRTSNASERSGLVETGDDAIRFVGKMKLWTDIAVGVLFSVGLIVCIVAMAVYHADWKSGAFAVEDIRCAAPEHKTSCNGKYGCHSFTVTQCTHMRLKGFAQTFTTQYVAPAKPPTVGETVRVFYDPKDRSQSFLAHDDFADEHKKLIIGGLTLVLLAVSVSTWFQYFVRKSHLAQRVAGGAAVFDLATGNGF